MISVSRPYIESLSGTSRLAAEISIDGNKSTIWFEVEDKYAQYLCSERSDAFVIGMLHYAMTEGHDIHCEAPIGEYLFYQITTDLIPTLSGCFESCKPIVIESPVDSSALPSAGAVGTGISCGVDSLHVLANHASTTCTKHKLTHLVCHNVGSHGNGERALKLFGQRKELARNFCEEYGYNFVEADSNIMEIIPQSHVRTHTFSSMFAVFCLQKLYSVYYYASGIPYRNFSFKDTDTANYDLFLLNCFSTDTLRLYSEGANTDRNGKIEKLLTYEPSYKYLNVCTWEFENCGMCEKCRRTLLCLDSYGALDLYGSRGGEVSTYRNTRITATNT